MKRTSRASNHNFIAMAILSTLPHLACSPSQKADSQFLTNSFSAISDSAFQCEQQIRKQMEEKAFKLETKPELNHEIDAANSIIKDLVAKPIYKVVQLQQETNEVDVQFVRSNSDTETALKYSLSRSADSGASLKFEVRFSQIESGQLSSIEQTGLRALDRSL